MAANSNVLDDARKLLEERLAELKDEIRRVERAITHLGRAPPGAEDRGGRASRPDAPHPARAGAAGATPAQTRR